MAEKKNDVKFHEEIQKMEYEPMDETELKLDSKGRHAPFGHRPACGSVRCE